MHSLARHKIHLTDYFDILPKSSHRLSFCRIILARHQSHQSLSQMRRMKARNPKNITTTIAITTTSTLVPKRVAAEARNLAVASPRDITGTITKMIVTARARRAARSCRKMMMNRRKHHAGALHTSTARAQGATAMRQMIATKSFQLR
jgi:hypothetical protein